ncbi:hypothetical protein IE81DRAFT_319641 [Ceraceosorus guamensis]|uniref:ARM repeat-containing protein n=1 Tax=Ceraceosorus guamensis TaxID=1522189 RepID=A0A316W9R4_9BASI|nr:hypothetical protein IE81DRAFT_319641 [Ceraceosorus guamensis]PWN45808.1 hypothetical protein IE81DRAFT_319641 [Ceraceosorus guamensis]
MEDYYDSDSDSESSVSFGESESEDDVDMIGGAPKVRAERTQAKQKRSRRPSWKDDRKKLMDLHMTQKLPYAERCESAEDFDRRLALIISKVVACIRSQDMSPGFMFWTLCLKYLLSLRYPMERRTRARLIRLYYHVALTPALDYRYANEAISVCCSLASSEKTLDSRHLVLPWRPLYEEIEREHNPKGSSLFQRGLKLKFFALAGHLRRFFDPDDSHDMLEEFLPQINGNTMEGITHALSLMAHFLPLRASHVYLPLLLRMWESFNSSIIDGHMLSLVSTLAAAHTTEPELSSENAMQAHGALADKVQGSKRGHDLESTTEDRIMEDLKANPASEALRQPALEVGIFTEDQFSWIMNKCLQYFADSQGSNEFAGQAIARQHAAHSAGTGKSKGLTPYDKMEKLAILCAYCLAEDGPRSATSTDTASTPVTQEATPNSAASSRSYLAGSRALEHVAKIVQASETCFHPSRGGPAQTNLVQFVARLLAWVHLRFTEEQKSDCKTPMERRITPQIVRELVLLLRPGILMSIFSKSMIHVVGPSLLALRSMAALEPELVLPAILERSFSSLEALETTQRTTAMLSALGALVLPLITRSHWRPGGKHLVPLFHLCLPALDINDFIKSYASSMFMQTAALLIKIDDLNSPEATAAEAALQRPGSSSVDNKVADLGSGDAVGLSDAEEDDALKISTADFEEWVAAYFRQILALLQALPDEGQKGKPGGKIEQTVIDAVVAACEKICLALSPSLFDLAFRIVADHCENTVHAPSVTAIGTLVQMFAEADSEKVLARLLPLCVDRIEAEIQHGASSTRTTSTSVPAASDTTLHWNLSILCGALASPGAGLLKYRDRLLKVLSIVLDRARSERGYVLASAVLSRVLNACLTIYPISTRNWNPEMWDSNEMTARSHLHWGETLRCKDTAISWHVPNDEEVSFGLEILSGLLESSYRRLEELFDSEQKHDKVWSNDFHRHFLFLRTAYTQLAAVIPLPLPTGEERGVPATDHGANEPEFLAPLPDLAWGAILRDPTDPRYQAVAAFRRRFGEICHKAANRMQISGAEDDIDCVKLLTRCIRTFMNSYAYSSIIYDHLVGFLGSFRASVRLHPKQKTSARLYWIRTAELHTTSRGKLAAMHRARSKLDDALLADLLELSLSEYTGVRMTAQRALTDVAAFYSGTRALCLPKLLDVLQPGSQASDDRYKGALYLLAHPMFQSTITVDPQWTRRYVEAVLQGQHRSKPSIQKVLRGKLLADLVKNFHIPLHLEVNRPAELFEAISLVEKLPHYIPEDPVVVRSIADGAKERMQKRQAMRLELLPVLLKIAQSKDTHWSYSLAIMRLLDKFLTKDRPLDSPLMQHVASAALDDNVAIRRVGQWAILKALRIAKSRALSPNDHDLAIGDTKHPLERIQQLSLPVTVEQSAAHWRSFGEELTPESELVDKSTTGWFVWGKERLFYAPPSETHQAVEWDNASTPGLDALGRHLFSADWWSGFSRHLTEERDRDYLGSQYIGLVEQVADMYGFDLMEYVRPTVEALVAEKDRHKHRAAAELVCGLVRGSKEWSQVDQRELWKWLDVLIPRVFRECTQDSQPAWLMFAEQAMSVRDPRRTRSLVLYVLNTAKEKVTDGDNLFSPWEQSFAHKLLRSAAMYLNARMSAWAAPDLLSLYSQHGVDSEFEEVRMQVSWVLAQLDMLQAHPSFGSVRQLLQASGEGNGTLLRPSVDFRQRLDGFMARLQESRKERRPMAQGASKYDHTALTVITWIASILSDHRQTALDEAFIDFAPHLFDMVELHDNRELSSRAHDVIYCLATFSWQGENAVRLVLKLLEVIDGAKASWHTRIDALRVVQVTVSQNLISLGRRPDVVDQVVELLLTLLGDAHPEVREEAATTLSGIVRGSQRKLITQLRHRFVGIIANVGRVPKRGDADFQDKILRLHSGILGVTALLGAFPYEVPKWMPDLICEALIPHDESPPPISTTVRKAAAAFKRSHQDTWEIDRSAFGDRLNEIAEWVRGSSSYFA